MNIAIISPHLDDALLSCGILIQKLHLSNTIFIINIFSKGKFDSERKKEDFEAFKNLKVNLVYFDELEAPSRNKRYQSIEELVFGKFDRTDFEYINNISSKITCFCEQNSIKQIYFPMAAGNHVDHRITFESCLNIPVEKFLYEERPYVLWDGILESKLKEFLLPTKSITRDQMLEKIDQYFFLKYFVPNGIVRENCINKYLDLLSDDKKDTSIMLEKNNFIYAEKEEVVLLYRCLKKYTSQMLNIYPNFEIFLKENLLYSKRIINENLYFERVWKIT